MAKELKDLTKRSVDYSRWYNELVVKADLAEQSPVRGCLGHNHFGTLKKRIFNPEFHIQPN